MIQTLAVKHNRTIAGILFLCFYLGIAAPLYAGTVSAYNHQGFYNLPAMYTGRPANPMVAKPNGTEALNEVKAKRTVPSTITVAQEEVLDSAMQANIGGPSQPEMSAFKSAGTSDMVNLFTGDFSYNIPLLDVGGYPVNIFYSGGISMEQEASWVGLGWNINPGTISRNMRGVPDDFDGTEKIQQEQNIKKNETWGGRLGADAELLGIKKGLKASAGLGFSYNNYLGPALDLSVKAGYSLKLAEFAGAEKLGKPGAGGVGSVNLDMGGSANLSSRDGLTINPNVSLSAKLSFSDRAFSLGYGVTTSYNSRSGIKSLTLYEQAAFNYAREKDKEPLLMGTWGTTTRSTSISFAKPSYIPAIRMPLTNTAIAGQVQAGGAMFGAEGSLEIEVYKQESEIDIADRQQVKPMIGYIYAQKATGNPDAIMDFTRFNDKEVTPQTAIISVPQYTYDVFSISGEGTGGSIRAYRNDYGYMRDSRVQSKDKSQSFGADIAPPGQFGANFNTVKTPSISGDWNQGNLLRSAIPFGIKDKLDEHIYFRNPGETSVLNDDQYKLIGGTDLVRFKLGGSNSNPEVYPVLERFNEEGKKSGEQNMKEVIAAQARQKRSQVISFLTAAEANVIGLDQQIRDYNRAAPVVADTLQYTSLSREDGFIRKAHHLSEINVTEGDGKRYIYGLPVYNTLQKDYTVTVSGTPDANDLVPVTSDELNVNRSFPADRDGYILTSQTPAYAHSFLLTGLLSPDYVDVTGNGITEDDLGTSVKFNYSKMPGLHRWRTPLPLKAHFNDGNMSETKDDKGIVSYGERELWYLHSLESKTMIAFFVLENRMDAKGVWDVYSSMNASDNMSQRLQRIELYNKADIRKNGKANAKPVKTVWFEYDYSLCGGTPGNSGATETKDGVNVNAAKGKLTLRSIYFTYNGQNRAQKSKYKFDYASSPAYEPNASDRWGNYKPKSQNPTALKNSIYPYAVQDNAAAIHTNAAAWNLNKIVLPSGGKIDIAYESDDYAYVQERRATRMMPVAHLGREALVQTTNNRLYETYGRDVFYENDKVYITVPEACATKQEVMDKYLDGINQLAFKLAVNMPKKKEYLTMYAQIEDYGMIAGQPKIWVQLKKVNGYSPLTITTLDYLREHLPGQAYSGYSPEGSGIEKFVKMLAGLMEGLQGAFKNPIRYLQGKAKAQTIVLAESFVRLNVAPGLKKYGGGHRVKSVTISDSWDKMTQQYNSSYGQSYDYTTTEMVSGTVKTISSGVASYEPSIGGEENPYQEMLQAASRLPLGPTNYESIEMPVLDAFFPAPLVGYSKVTVTSIKKGQPTPGNKKPRSGTGKQVTEFYTAKDFPVRYDYTRIDPASDKQEHVSSLFSFFDKCAFDSRAISQGFRVILNDMHGKLKSQSAYAETDPNSRISYSEYRYRNTGAKGLDEKFDFIHQSLGGEIKPGNMGIDVELMTDAREFSVRSHSVSVQVQVDWMAVFLPVWLPFIWPTNTETENYYRAVTTTKVINYHSLVDSVRVMDKGSVVTTRNMIYDAETGNVVVSRTSNVFDKPVYSTSQPAYWAYSGMGPAYRNINAVFSGITFTDGKITAGIAAADLKKYFESGDELFIISSAGITVCEGMPVSGAGVRKIWALDKNKNSSSLTNTAPDFIFIDEKGLPYTRASVSLRIIRSGKRNMLGAQLQTLSSLANPEVLVSGKRKLSFSANVLNASAMEYKEKWQTDKDVMKRYKEVIKPDLPAGSNLIANGNFSSGNTGFSSEYTYYPASYSSYGEGRYTIRTVTSGWLNTSATCYDHTSGGGSMMVVNGHTAPNKVLWSTTVNVLPDREYAFSMWGLSIFNNNIPTIKVLVNNVDISSEKLSANNCDWVNIQGRWKSGSSTIAEIKIVDNSTSAIGNDFAIDDLVFYALTKPFCDPYEIEDCDGYFEKQVNPYRKGLLGTFRSHRNMVFYEERMQGQTTYNAATKISTDGALKNFAVYWAFNSSFNMVPLPSARWVWNSEITRVNARGLELETRDALDIYTAAQYGYAKNLPVAIANNARSQEMAYTGFEDGNYSEALNRLIALKCGKEQHFYFDATGIVSQQEVGIKAHSGKYMIRINSGKSEKLLKGLGDYCQPEFALDYKQAYAIKIPDYGFRSSVINSCVNVNGDYFSNSQRFSYRFVTNGKEGETVVCPNETAILEGYIDIKKDGIYDFYDTIITKVSSENYPQTLECHFGQSDPPDWYIGGMPNHEPNGYIGVNNKKIEVFDNTDKLILMTQFNMPKKLSKGIYKVRYTIEYSYEIEGWNTWYCPWGSPMPYTIGTKVDLHASFDVFRNCEFYRSDTLFVSKTVNSTNTCLYTKALPATDSMTNPIFQPIPGKKMLLSAWLREPCTDPCMKQTYTDGKVKLVYNNSSGAEIGSSSFTASGPIIEGWQKIEKEFTIPTGAATVELVLENSNASQPVYFDDIRIHPYDANMKSYVYDPVNLRLVAELDANNYATFYEYDEEGGLIRTKAETYEGIKTIKETRSANHKLTTIQ